MMQIYIYWNTHVLAETIEKAVAEYIRTLFYNFQYCYHCCEDKGSLSVGSHADKCLYSLLFSGEKRYVSLTEEKIEEIRGAAHVIIYGAGRAADETIQILTEHGIHIDGLAVSEEKENSLHLRGIEVRNIAEFIEYKNDAAVIVGVTKKYSDEMRAKLCEMGFQHIVMLDDCDI